MLDDDDPADIAQSSRDQCGSNSESHPNIMPWLSWILNALRDDNEFDSNKDVYPNQDQVCFCSYHETKTLKLTIRFKFITNTCH